MKRTLFMAVAICIFMLGCSEKEPPSQEAEMTRSTAAEQFTGEPAASDTSLADEYYGKAEELARTAQHDSAIAYFKLSSEAYKTEENWEKYVECLRNMGATYQNQGKSETAMSTLRPALGTAIDKLGLQHLKVGNIYGTIGNVYLNSGATDSAIAFYEKALSIHVENQGEANRYVATDYYSLGRAYHDKGDYEEAIAFLEKSLLLRRRVLGEQHTEVAACYNILGLIFMDKADYDKALAYYQQALLILEKQSGRRDIRTAMIYGNLGGVYMRKADYDKALEFYNKAKAIFVSQLGEMHPYVGFAYGNMGDVYTSQGDYTQALRFIDNALAVGLATLGEQHPEVAKDYFNKALLYFHQGEYDQAIEFQKKSLSIRLSTLGELHPDIGQSYRNLAAALAKKGNYKQALASLERALSIFINNYGGQHPDLGLTYKHMGLVNFDQGHYDRAIEFYQKAAQANSFGDTVANAHENPPLNSIMSEALMLEVIHDKSQAFRKRFDISGDLQDLQASLADHEYALRVVEHMRSGYKAEDSKLLLAGQATEIYDQAIQAALRMYETTMEERYKLLAFTFAEKSKVNILLEALAETEAKKFAGIPDSLTAKEHELRIDLAFYERSLIEEELKRDNADSARIALWRDKVFALKQKYDDLLQRFENDFPDYYNLKYQVETISVQEVQKQILDENTALVEYFVATDSIFVFVVKKNEFEVVATAKGSLLEQRVKHLRAGIVERDFAEYTETAFALHQNLFAPIIEGLRVDKLIIVPGGILNSLPFEALLTESAAATADTADYANLPYLVNKYTISYAYSATLLLQSLERQHEQVKRDYLAFAPVFPQGVPSHTRSGEFFEKSLELDSTHVASRIRGYLPSSKKEVEDIFNVFNNSYGFFERLLSRKSRVYLEREAREDAIKSAALKDYRYLHFATHGFVNESTPKLSGLLLAPDTTSKEDGILYLGEIYNLDLEAELVTLSACETGLGQIAKGEGIIGLTRGFLYAGASNLLVSLWQVSDASTADLMVEFYDGMLRGKSKAEALRAAKLRLMRSYPEYARPYYWAPFVLIGK